MFVVEWQLYQGSEKKGIRFGSYSECLRYLDTIYGVYKVTIVDLSMYYKNEYRKNRRNPEWPQLY